jgi:hypothetical protein
VVVDSALGSRVPKSVLVKVVSDTCAAWVSSPNA